MNIFTWLKRLFRGKGKPVDLSDTWPTNPFSDIIYTGYGLKYNATFGQLIDMINDSDGWTATSIGSKGLIPLWSDPATSEEELGEYMRTKGGDAYGLRSRKNMES